MNRILITMDNVHICMKLFKDTYTRQNNDTVK